MLYSEIKERENRFFLSLKIAIPFIFFLIFIFFLLTTKINIRSLLENNIIPFLIIFFIYIYYILYQIYMGFKTSVIDNTTKAFSREYMIKIINTMLKKENLLLVGVKIKNIIDINERYGFKKTDIILEKFVQELNVFLVLNGFKNIAIGHVTGGNFIFLIKCDEKQINHIMKQFIHNIEKNQIDNIFLKLIFSYVNNNSEDNAEDLLTSLFENIKLDGTNRRKKRRLNIKVNEFEKLVMDLIDKKEFEFRFQPILNYKNNNIEIYEVLIRLNSKKYGKILQNQFISVINRIGYEIIYDEILIEELFKIYLDSSSNVKLSINLSSYSIRNNEFINKIKKLTKQNGINPQNFIFEISGNNNLNDIIRLKENIDILRKLGFLIAIDNFGADNTTFKYIKNLNIDIIKFDIEYSKNKDEKLENILQASVDMFKKLKVKTVIKFVENDNSFNNFKSLGIDFVQGYVVGKPVTKIK